MNDQMEEHEDKEKTTSADAGCSRNARFSKYYLYRTAVKTREDVKSLVRAYREKGAGVFSEIEKDMTLAGEDVRDIGKKALHKLPWKERLEERLSSTVEQLHSRLNLPTRNDVNVLQQEIERLHAKLDALVSHEGKPYPQERRI